MPSSQALGPLPKLLLVILVLFISLLLPPSTNAALADRQGSPLVEYNFPYSECLEGSKSTSWKGSMTSVEKPAFWRNETVTDCRGENSIGLTSLSTLSAAASPRLAANATDGMLGIINHLDTSGATGLSFEFWIKPARETQSKDRVLFTIGKDTFDPLWLKDKCTMNNFDSGYFDLQIVQSYVVESGEIKYSVIYSGSDDEDISPGEACIESFKSAAIEYSFNEAIHVVVSLTKNNDGSRFQYIYINNIQKRPFIPYFFDWSLWGSAGTSDKYGAITGADYQLQLFPDLAEIYKPFYGDLLYFAIHDVALSQAEVTANYNAFLDIPVTADHAPVMIDIQLRVYEGGDSSSEPHQNSWYDSPVPLEELMILTLTGATFDVDQISSSVAPPLIYIADLPPKGKLYAAIWPYAELRSGDSLPANQLKYRPDDKDGFGANYDSFQLKALDGKVDNLWSENESTVTISVTRVNDPPKAEDLDIGGIFSWQAQTLTLVGGDPDFEDRIQRISLESYPKHGVLHQVNADGSEGQLIESFSGASIFLEALEMRVMYTFTGDETLIEDEETGKLLIPGGEFFTFRLQDNGSGDPKKSDLKTVTISSVYFKMDATPSNDQWNITDYTAFEDEMSDVLLHGLDYADEPRSLQYEITALPVYGDLYDPAHSGDKLAVGSIISTVDVYNGSLSKYRGVAVKYFSNLHYFNYPTVNYKGGTTATPDLDSFKYKAVLYGANAVKSKEVTQPVRVLNVNDPTLISGPTTALSVFALFAGTSRWDDVDCELEPTSNFCAFSDHLVFDSTTNTITITEVDQDTDRVVMHIKTMTAQGFLSFKQEVRGLPDYKCADENGVRIWECFGKGVGQNEMRFSILPSDINSLLDGLMYVNLDENLKDRIVITIHDGGYNSTETRNLCIPEIGQPYDLKHHKMAAVRYDTCLSTTLEIDISVGPYLMEYEEEEKSLGLAALSFAGEVPLPAVFGLIGFVAVLFCCTLSYLRHVIVNHRMVAEKAASKIARDRNRRNCKKLGESQDGTTENTLNGADLEKGDEKNSQAPRKVSDVEMINIPPKTPPKIGSVPLTGMTGGTALTAMKINPAVLPLPPLTPERRVPSVFDDDVPRSPPQTSHNRAAFLVPPSPPSPSLRSNVKQATPERNWYGYIDGRTGQTYYQAADDATLTWTMPKTGIIRMVDDRE
jgi:hypothetical protein